MAIYGDPNDPTSKTFSQSLTGLDEIMSVLPNNDNNYISARNVRDVAFTLWLNGGGGGGSFSYTQTPPLTDKSTVAVGGIPVGTTFENVSLQSLFDSMFFPPLDNEYSISGGGSFEFGTTGILRTITVSLNQKNSNQLTNARVVKTSDRSAYSENKLQLSPSPPDTQGKDVAYTPRVYTNQTVDEVAGGNTTTWTLTVFQSGVQLPSRTTSVSFFKYRFWGAIDLTSYATGGSDFNFQSASPAQRTAIQNVLIGAFVTNQNKEENQLSRIQFTHGTSRHLWMAWPSDDYGGDGVPSGFKDGNLQVVNIFSLLKTGNLVNAQGASSEYKFYISDLPKGNVVINIVP